MTENQLSTIIVDAAIEVHHELGGSGMERQVAKAQSRQGSSTVRNIAVPASPPGICLVGRQVLARHLPPLTALKESHARAPEISAVGSSGRMPVLRATQPSSPLNSQAVRVDSPIDRTRSTDHS